MSRCFLVSVLLGALLPTTALAGYVVQQDAATLTSGQTTVDLALPANVSSLDKAFVMLHYFYGHTPGVNGAVTAADGMVNAYLWDNAGTSTIRFTRSGSGVDVQVSWAVVECTDNEFTVYRGQQAWSGTGQTYSPAIGATVNGDNCLAWINGTTSSEGSSIFVREAHFTADVGAGAQSSLNVRRFQVSGTPGGTLRWIVVEFDPAKIGGLDTGELTVSNQTEASPATFSIAGCQKSRSLLLGQWRVSGDDGLNAHALALRMANDTSGEVYVHTNTSYARTLRWYCLDLGPDAGSRLEGQVDNSANNTWTVADQTLAPAVDPSRTLSFVTLTSNGNGTAFPRPMLRHWVSGSSTLEIERDYSGQGSWIEWQVLELPAPVVSTPPSVVAGTTAVSVSQVDRSGTATVDLSATFTDSDLPGVGAFAVTFKVREPDNSTEVVLVNGLTSGNGGLVVTDEGGGSYTAGFSWDPGPAQALGAYDLYFEVTDGTAPAVDGFAANPDELTITEPSGPAIVAGTTAVSTSPLDPVGAGATILSATFTDAGQLPAGSYFVTFKVREPDNISEIVVANALVHGVGGMTVVDNGGGSYTAGISWDPVDGAATGPYDLYFEVSDGTNQAVDGYPANLDELLLSSGSGGAPPAVAPDAVFASPVGVERTGASSTVISATFHDPDTPPVGVFLVTFLLRLPDNTTELVLAQDQAHGQSGVTVVYDGNGYFTASISWDPPDGQSTGFYDLYFSVFEGTEGAVDGYVNNLDELQVYDAISNNPPTVAAGAVTPLPASVNRIGSDFTMLKAAFSDPDMPGPGNFLVTLKVRSPGGLETLVVDNARNGEQGLRITNVGGPAYVASVLWDPPVSAETGAYDLHFWVSDLLGGTATDDYAANADELQVHATTPAGDGYLLHRTREADNCGGPNSACHNLSSHQSANCLTCHTAHGSRNIYLIKETIDTPNSGPKTVVVKTLGIGDPYNDPDPVAGDPNSGTLADDSDGVYTGVCEVCHTSTSHHRNDATTPLPGHNNATNCTSCHGHEGGFSGGESGGGSSCSCHSEIMASMATGMPGFHHEVSGDPVYSSSTRTCLSCHVDHDLFRPDLNPGIGTRASNLRSDATNVPVPGDNTVLANSDYIPTGTGGLCISCHAGDDCLVCHEFQPAQKAAFNHNFVNKAAFDAATSAHNYSVPSTFGTDGSVFNGNCVKCHNGTLTKNFQNSTNKFGIHLSEYQEILDPLGVVSPSSPLEEAFCFQCHSTTSNPNSGSSLDYYGSQPMSNAGPMSIEADLSLASTHPVGGFNGIHDPAESPVTMARHVECMDCHNPHEATADRPPSPSLSGALYGVEGVMVDGSRIERSTNSYQICFKCHGDRPGTTPAVNRKWLNMNTRDEFKPTSQSFHPVTAPGTNSNSPSLISPWTEASIMLCEDCHGSSGAGAAGPHGSQYSPILKLRYDRVDPNPENAADYALCYSCHDRNSILGDLSFKEHNVHVVGDDVACYVCHDAHGVASAGAGDGTHLINFNTDVVTNSSSGRMEFIDNGSQRGSCYLTCHGKNHNPLSY